MFDLDNQEDTVDHETHEPVLKKKKLSNSGFVHSSLRYSSFKAPPLIEYKSIDGYCENKLGKSLLLSSDSVHSPSTSGLNNLQSVSSPIMFRSPKPLAMNKMSPVIESKSHVFFSVEELSLVKCLKNWTNTKVCAVGTATYNRGTQQCYLQSVMEKGHWTLLLDTSLLQEIPNLEKLLQVFGTLEIANGVPRVKVNFYRNLGSIDLQLFIESYKLMQKYVPDIVNPFEKENVEKLDKSDVIDTSIFGVELNDTLDDYSFSNIL